MRQLKKRSLCGSLASSEASYRSCRDVCCEAATSMQLAQGVAVSAGGHVPPTGARAAPTRSAGTDPDPDEEPLCPLAAGPGERLRSAGWGCRCSLCLAGRQLPGPRLLQPGRSSPELPSRRHGPHRARVPRRSRWGPLSGSQKGYVDAKVTSDFSILPCASRAEPVKPAPAPTRGSRHRSVCPAGSTDPSEGMAAKVRAEGRGGDGQYPGIEILADRQRGKRPPPLPELHQSHNARASRREAAHNPVQREKEKGQGEQTATLDEANAPLPRLASTRGRGAVLDLAAAVGAGGGRRRAVSAAPVPLQVELRGAADVAEPRDVDAVVPDEGRDRL
mmetsp:Transcript_572/g.1287  ORF Transcript_572/g.1287 Transcript_572/m.1287 type:complete len:333 (-) Transcript_572:1648-2646(-)